MSDLLAQAPPGPDEAYWTFYEEVASRQLADWLPSSPRRVLDLSGGDRFALQMAAAGHTVVQVTGPDGDGTDAVPLLAHRVSPGGMAEWSGAGAGSAAPGRVVPVVADPRDLACLAGACVDAVLAESRFLSFCLAAEQTVEAIFRVLRPGGRLLLCVDSLLLGLARLAEQGRWAELADAPAADVVLVPGENGAITRCFWTEELQELLLGAGFEVEWIRPRTVLSQAAVERAVHADPTCLESLIDTEVSLAADRQGESIGIHLVASARRPD